MVEQRSLIVGFDLCNDYSQLSCFNDKNFEPESICVTSDKTKYLIPTVLGIKNDSKEWVFGDEAIALENNGSGLLIKDLLTKVKENQETELFGVLLQPVTLLEKYFRKCLQLLKVYYPSNSIQKIVITLKVLNEELKEGVYQALSNLGIGKDRAFVQNHSRSYQYYALSQNKELWINDVGLFVFDEGGLTYQQITINRKSTPYLVGIVEKDFSDILNYSVLEEIADKEKLEYIFRNLAKNVLYKQIVSTIYVTGKGFESNWADTVLKELCVGRRIFKGQNLYTKGACYAAKELLGESKFEDFLFLGSDMISSIFYISGYFDSKPSEAILTKAATPWYEVDEKIDFILDDEDKITISIKNLLKHETTTHSIMLEGLPKRPNKMTRVEVRIKFLNKTTAIVTVKDKGFGNFYPSSNRIWEKEISGEEQIG